MMLIKMGVLSKNEYDDLKGLWMLNVKPPNAEPICEKCSDIWNAVLIAHEPDTEYLTLSHEERMKSLETSHPEDKDKFITFK